MSFRVKGFIFLLFLSVAFYGCLTVPPSSIYTINYRAHKTASYEKLNDKVLLILQTDAPSALKQPYIVSKSTPYKIEIMKYQKWETSPREMVYNRLKDFTSSIGFQKTLNPALENHYTLKSRLNSFGRIFISGIYYADFDIEIEFYSHENKLLFLKRIQKIKALENDDFENLAKGLDNVIKEGLKELELEFLQIFRN